MFGRAFDVEIACQVIYFNVPVQAWIDSSTTMVVSGASDSGFTLTASSMADYVGPWDTHAQHFSDVAQQMILTRQTASVNLVY